MLDAEVSPDGKQLAMVSNQGSSSFRLWLADDPEDFRCPAPSRPPMRACKVTWRGDSKEVLVVQGDADCEEDVAVLARVPIDDVRNQKELNASGDDPSYQPLDHRGLSGVLCPSCRRQLERGASYCGSCGTPLNGASAPLELVLGDATRVPVVAEMTIGRAPGRVARAHRPVGVAHARADLGRRGARGRGLAATARGWTACA